MRHDTRAFVSEYRVQCALRGPHREVIILIGQTPVRNQYRFGPAGLEDRTVIRK